MALVFFTSTLLNTTLTLNLPPVITAELSKGAEITNGGILIKIIIPLMKWSALVWAFTNIKVWRYVASLQGLHCSSSYSSQLIVKD